MKKKQIVLARLELGGLLKRKRKHLCGAVKRATKPKASEATRTFVEALTKGACQDCGGPMFGMAFIVNPRDMRRSKATGRGNTYAPKEADRIVCSSCEREYKIAH